jgi:hypothetical protein
MIPEKAIKIGTTFSKTLDGNDNNKEQPIIEPKTVKIEKKPTCFQCPFSSLVEEIVEPILVQISAASLVTFAYTGGIPTASNTGYDASEAIEATDESNPPATPPTKRKIIVPIEVIDKLLLHNSLIHYNAIKERIKRR